MSLAYHYCSVETFLNIIKNKTFFLSDPLKMNDSAELIHYLDSIDSSIWGRMNKRRKLLIISSNLETIPYLLEAFQKRVIV